MTTDCSTFCGIGVETARVLALRRVYVVMPVRNTDAGANVKEAILKEIPNAKIDVRELDLSSFTSVRKFAADYHSSGLPLNILIYGLLHFIDRGREGKSSAAWDKTILMELVHRNGTVWTSSAHIITAVIGSGVLSAWATAQLGWVAGPSVMLLFSFVTYYTSTLLSACYRSGDSVTGKRNYTYMDAVRSNLGGAKVKICGYVQYLNLFGVSIGYTIASSISTMAIKRSNCFHKSGGKNPCHINSNPYVIAFGITEIILSNSKL